MGWFCFRNRLFRKESETLKKQYTENILWITISNYQDIPIEYEPGWIRQLLIYSNRDLNESDLLILPFHVT